MYKYRVFLTNQKVVNINIKRPLRKLMEEILENTLLNFLQTVYINSTDGVSAVKFNQIVAFELIEEPFDLEKEIDKFIPIINEAILKTPTGELRNKLTNVNIILSDIGVNHTGKPKPEQKLVHEYNCVCVPMRGIDKPNPDCSQCKGTGIIIPFDSEKENVSQ